MEFEKLVVEILQENNVAGGVTSALGPNVGKTATTFSGDTYAPGDVRTPKSLYSGVITRSGMKASGKKKKKKTK